jgi:hypothetical protein
MRFATRLISIAAVIAATVSCGDVVRQGSSPVYLSIDRLDGLALGKGTAQSVLLSDVITNVRTPDPCSAQKPCPTIFNDLGVVNLRAPLKDIGATATLSPTSNNDVTVTRIHVEYIRADGRNTPGVDIPYAFDAAVNWMIPGGGTLQGVDFELVRHAAKEESPLVQLVNSDNIISATARVTFYGTDRVGNQIQAVGQIQIEFGNFGDQ